MPGPCVVVLPGRLDPSRREAVGALRAAGLEVLDLDLLIADRAPLSMRVCAAIREPGGSTPLVVIAPPASTAIVPAVALAQRTAHRRVLGYVLVNPADDPTGGDWPDAPVEVVDTGDGVAANRARLRGWGSRTGASTEALCAAVSELLD